MTAYIAIMNCSSGKVKNMASYNYGEIWEYEVKTGEVKKALVVSPNRRANDSFIAVICLNATSNMLTFANAKNDLLNIMVGGNA